MSHLTLFFCSRSMSTEANLPDEIPPLPPSERKARWWAWPLSILSILSIGWSVNVFGPEEGGSSSGAESSEVAADPADLALLKIQGQIVIAAATFSPKEIESTLEDLSEVSEGDRAVASIALLESFIAIGGRGGGDPVSTLDGFSESVSPSLRSLTEKAVTEGINEEERVELESEVGWFSRLAPSPGLESPPGAMEIRTRSMLLAGIGGLFFMAALLGIVAGGILLFLFVHRERVEGGVRLFDRGQTPQGIMLECFALYLGIMAGGEWIARFLHPGMMVSVYGLSVAIPLLWPRVRGIRWKSFARSIGFHTGRGFWKEVGAGFVGYLGVIALASIGIFLTLLLAFTVEKAGGMMNPGEGGGGAPLAPETHPIVGWIYTGGWQARILCLLLAAGFAPFFEELLFRGALHRYLRGRYGFVASALLTGLIFAALHPQGWLGIPALAAMGVGFSLIREWRDSLIAPMVAHAINNGALVIALSFAL